MARVKPLFRGLGAALLVALALTCVACAAPSGSQEANMSDVVEAVENADARVTDVKVEKSTDGLSVGWVVDVVLEGADPVSPEELSALLLAVRHAGEREPGHVDLFATSSSGATLDLEAPADALDLRYSSISTGIGVLRTAIDDALGVGNG